MSDSQALLDHALQLHVSGQFALAEQIYRRLFRAYPDNAEYLRLLGLAALSRGNPKLAARRLLDVTQRIPASAPAHREAALALRAAASFSQAESHLLTAVSLDPTYSLAVCELGRLLLSQGRIQDALSLSRNSCSQCAASADLLALFAEAALLAQSAQEALQAASQLNQILPSHPKAKSLLARALRDSGRLNASLRLSSQILRSDPASFDALYCRFSTFQKLGDIDNALRCGRRLLATPRGRNPIIASRLLHLLLFSKHSPPHIFRSHIECAPIHTPAPPPRPLPLRRLSARRPIRIGIFSHQFAKRKPEILPILEHFDSEGFELHCFSDPKPAAPGQETDLSLLATSWTDISSLSDLRAAKLIRQKKIDILFNFDSHLHGERFPLFAAPAAPINANFAIYPASSASCAFQYLVTDPHLDPPGQSEHLYTERLIRIPLFAVRQPHSFAPPVALPPALRNGFVTFGSFSTPLKINASVVELWASILKRVPNSRLLLHNHFGPLDGPLCPDITNRIAKMFRRHGVAANRLDYVPDLPLPAHLALYGQIDIALDPFPFNGMSTTFAALWMGVPVISLWGRSAVSRVGGSLLSAAGLSPFVRDNPADYADFAVQTALNLEALHARRQSLRPHVAASRLFDLKTFACSLQQACLEMLRLSRLSLP